MTCLDRIGYQFRKPELLLQAMTHISFHHENLSSSVGDNERLEFLGDAVLDLGLSDLLMRRFPAMSEGDLSKIRASLVNETVLCQMGSECGISDHLRLGRGEKASGGSTKPRLVASAFEALFGAIYLDGGFLPAHQLVEAMFAPHIETIDLEVFFKADYKTRLQEKTQALFRKIPVYDLRHHEGPDHEKTFFVDLKVEGRLLASGTGKSKKQAEQDAARLALESLEKDGGQS